MWAPQPVRAASWPPSGAHRPERAQVQHVDERVSMEMDWQTAAENSAQSHRQMTATWPMAMVTVTRQGRELKRTGEGRKDWRETRRKRRPQKTSRVRPRQSRRQRQK